MPRQSEKFPYKTTTTNRWQDMSALFAPLAGWSSKTFWSSVLDGVDGISSLNSGQGADKSAQLNPHIANALYEYSRGESAGFTLCKISEGNYSVEVPINRIADGGKRLLAHASFNGTMQAAIIDVNSGAWQALPPWGTKEILDRGVPQEALWVFFALIGALNDTCKDEMMEWLDGQAQTCDWSQPLGMVYRFCDAAYWSAKNDLFASMSDGSGNVPLLSKDVVESNALEGEILCGPYPTALFGSNPGQKQLDPHTIGGLKQKVKKLRATRDWTEEERMMIPDFPDDFPVMEEVATIVEMYAGSTGMVRPMRNFLWRGVTSYGKSHGCKQIACILDLPLVTMECSPTMTAEDFKVKIVPDTSSTVRTVPNVPDFEEIENDPETAYFKLTGERKTDVTCQDCLDVYADAVLRNAPGGNQLKLKYVDSEFVKAVRNGWIVEIQEPSTIRDAGVLAGLNKIDEPGATMALLDGTYVRRHENTMVISTDNVSYAGCRPLNQSVIRRNAFAIDSYKLSKEELLGRIRRNTGFDNEKMLEQMYRVWESVCEKCKESDITDGSTSATELEMWAQAVMISGMRNVKQLCRWTVINKATSNVEDQDILMSTVSTILND